MHDRPLGLRPDAHLDQAQLRALQVLQDYDLDPVRDRLIRHGIMHPTWVDEAILEFRRYCGMHAVQAEGRIMFSERVDTVWHTCLLFTELYADYCHQAFGHFYHHVPGLGRGGDRAAAFREFTALYERLYGELGRLWTLERPPSSP